ncbi:Queuine tRNA-ribosyltransferase-like protein [Apiospora arundinis]|uniref:Queuine tRNA-ribosyltransferase-like protein n=1 Tax=Apiospora arundinis TaxID=335852 RepID=A0ABR2JHJ2_9PEZI
MADSEAAQMRNADYWDGRYSNADDPATKEWHVGPDKLEGYLEENIYPLWPLGPETTTTSTSTTIPRMVHLGSGASSVPFEMFARGYTDQTCLEFSAAVLAQMAPRNAAVAWLPHDVRRMPEVASASFDFAFDKATFYALCAWGPTHLLKSIPAVIVEDTAAYSREVYRILKPGGVFCCINIFEPRYVHHLLKVEGTDWADLHAPIALTPAGWAQTRAYGLVKRGPVTEKTGHPPVLQSDEK